MPTKPDKIPVRAGRRLGLKRTSRFSVSHFYPDLQGGYSRWPYNIHTLKPHDSDEFYTVEVGEEMRWDYLAHKIYGSTFLWWVLPLVNGSRDPFDGRPFVGEVLRVPQVSRILGLQQVV